MAKRFWKSVEELRGERPEGDPRREFGPEVEAAMADIRREYGLDGTTGEVVQVDSADGRSVEERADQLRRLLPQVSRRGFMQLTGAAAVFALAGCWPEGPETLAPYRQQPEGSTIGKPRFFSTTIRVGGQPIPVMAKSYDGRPIKLEGNPDDPIAQGSLSLRGQAAILDLYDPDRLKHGPQRRDGEGWARLGWSELDQAVGALLQAGDVALLTGPLDGPANRRLLADFAGALGNRLKAQVAYHAYAKDEIRESRRLAFGDAERSDPVYHFEKASCLITLGSDPLAGGHGGLYDDVGFGHLRRVRNAGANAEMAQFIAFEPVMTQSGAKADLRLRVAMEDMAVLGWGLAVRVAQLLDRTETLPTGIGSEILAKAKTVLPAHPILAEIGEEPLDYAAKCLVEAKKDGKHSLVYVGGAVHDHVHSRPIHLAACFLNLLLGNEGVTVETATAPKTAVLVSREQTIALLKACAAGEVKTMLVWGTNPVYSLPHAAEMIAAARAKGMKLVFLGDRLDETALLADYLAPITHDLESWGDAEPRAGIFSIQQPVAPRPLWDERQPQESLMAFALAAGLGAESFGAERLQERAQEAWISRVPLWQPRAHGVKPWRIYLRETWATDVRTAVGSLASPETFWTSVLAQGLVVFGAPTPTPPKAFNRGALAQHQPKQAQRPPFTLVLSASRNMGDGEQSNNAWLQETPDPISRVTWDNYLAMHWKDAEALGLESDGDGCVRLTVGDQAIDVPVVVQPGQMRGVVELFLGWGRNADLGTVSRQPGAIGQAINAFQLVDDRRWGIPVEVERSTRSYKLAKTQYHHHMDGRDIVIDDPLVVHRADPDGSRRAAHHHRLWEGGTGAVNRLIVPGGPRDKDLAAAHPEPTPKGKSQENLSMWDRTHVYPGRRWGMVIDQNACIACQACVVACQAENNIPVVGREEVRRGREMHWIRVDRYYTTAVEPVRSHDDFTDSRAIRNEDPELIEVLFQPVLCQHCGHAPCEEVCPPMATMHNDEGLNLQIYNRCIGTRFCANNCPYKVRRFNFYEYTKYRYGPFTDDPLLRVVRNVTTEMNTSSRAELGGTFTAWEAPLSMVLNPVVTLRSKGVMEKCTFCIQRTRDIRELEKRTNKQYDDEDRTLTTACAQTCPTHAIVFGDINDPFSRVTDMAQANPHHYHLLDDVLNTRPAVAYLRHVRNRPPSKLELAELHPAHPGAQDHGGESYPGLEKGEAPAPEPHSRTTAGAADGKES